MKLSSYFMNGAASGCGSGSRDDGIDVGSAFKHALFAPDAVAFVEADEQTPFYFNDGSFRPDERLSMRHGIGVIGTFGGGAEYIPYQEYERQVGTSSTEGGIRPGRFWCNRGSATGD